LLFRKNADDGQSPKTQYLCKIQIGEQKYQTDDKLKRNFLKWLLGQDEAFYAAGVSNLPG
jgi:hypothetical protein